MNILGTLFITVGVLLCLTIILFLPGLACVAVGALLKIAASRSKR